MPKKRIEIVDLRPSVPLFKRRQFCVAHLQPYVAQRNIDWLERHKKEKGKLSKLELRRLDNGLGPHECAAFARYRIQGKLYCRKHAALLALDLVAEKIEQGEA